MTTSTFRRSASLLILLVLHPWAGAAIYYVDALGGDDARSGASPSLAWRTLAHVSSAQVQGMLAPGDRVLFQSGQSFAGALVASASGAVGAPITYGSYAGSYGTGAKPVIQGSIVATGWTAVGGGVWECACPGAAAAVNVVTLDGAMQAMGRFPNADAPNGGYLTFESHVGTTSITDLQLSATPDWTGAEVVIRKVHWIIDRNRITAHSGNTVSYASASVYQPQLGFGYFIQNDARTLDAVGEWYFDPSTTKLRVCFGPAGPGVRVVRVGAIDTLVDVAGRHDITIDGLALLEANRDAIDAHGSVGIRVQDCTIACSGNDAVLGSGSDHIAIERCAIAWTGNIAIDCAYPEGPHAVIRGNAITDTAVIAGMGGSGDGTYQAIMAFGDGSIVEDNSIERTGYIAINFQGNDVLVRDNVIDGFGLLKDDGGGIYTYSGMNPPAFTRRRVVGNIVLNGIGAPAGTETTAGYSHGIYLDDNTPNVELSGNSIAYCSASGIFLHNAHDIAITGNTVFGNGRQMLMDHSFNSPGTDPIRNVVSTDNIFCSRTSHQLVLDLWSDADDFGQFGPFDRNCYARPLDARAQDGGFTITTKINGQVAVAHDLQRWKSHSLRDGASRTAAVRIAPYTVSSLGANLYGNPTFDAGTNDAGAWSVANNATVSWNSGGRLDGGAMQFGFQPASGTPNPSILTFGVQAVQSTKSYVLRFSAIASGELSFEVYLRNLAGERLAPSSFGGVGTSRGEREYLFTAPVDTASPMVDFDFNESSAHGPFWMDNVRLCPAVVALTDPDACMRFECNRGGTPRTVALSEDYVDMDGLRRSGSVVIAPHASLILVKASAVSSPVITSGVSISAAPGAVVSYAITASHAPTSFSASGLPTGLSLDAATGLISGVPTALGTSSITVSASNADGTGTLIVTLSIGVAAASPAAPPAHGGASTDGGGHSHVSCGLGSGLALVLGTSLFWRLQRLPLAARQHGDAIRASACERGTRLRPA